MTVAYDIVFHYIEYSKAHSKTGVGMMADLCEAVGSSVIAKTNSILAIIAPNINSQFLTVEVRAWKSRGVVLDIP